MIYDTSITIAYRILKELFDESWRPLCVQFSYGKPGDTAAYRQFFNTRVRFNAEVSGVVFESKWLSSPIADAEPNLHFDVVREVQQEENKNALDFIDQVRIVLPQMVLSGTVSSQAVAALFGFSERTLRRRLVEQSTGLQKLLDEARFELARQLLGNTSLTVAEIALSLNYSDPNVFSRAFRKWAGLSPTRWRRQYPTKS
jgi:AraC-like DNA-binding protein